MASVSIRNVHKRFGQTPVLHGVSIEIPDGSFTVLVGPSGCGKSTLLRMVAGLENISDGEVAIGGKVVNQVAPKERDIAMVFQNYALYPHMTVRDNMAFSLALAKKDKAFIDERVGKAAGILGLAPLLDRFPRQLSGGQRQRVAMGRCIVRDPQVFLFDEPLSNLDAKLRDRASVDAWSRCASAAGWRRAPPRPTASPCRSRHATESSPLPARGPRATGACGFGGRYVQARVELRPPRSLANGGRTPPGRRTTGRPAAATRNTSGASARG